ncbi:tRNA (cytosine(38)-C(5))-methyltransferase-like [Ornithodoros turicata]
MDCHESNDNAPDNRLRVLELYSGIGGMHYACPPDTTRVVAAVDVNTTANVVYKFNFPETVLLQRNVQSFKQRELDSLRIDVLTMSPPCQPFTRQGLQRDAQDPRSSSFLNLIQVLPTLAHPPRYILLENVKGFETSSTCAAYLDFLTQHGFHFHRYLLSPTQFGVPNSRLRFYCLAKRGRFSDCPSACDSIWHNLPTECSRPAPLYNFLEEESDSTSEYLLPDIVLSKFAFILDIVDRNATNTCCFTKGYGHYVEGTGSVLLQSSRDAMDDVYRDVSPRVSSDDVLPASVVERLCELRLRYFTPQEVSRLMCFPEQFRFPQEVTPRQRYRLLGNSVNVRLVRELMQHLLNDADLQNKDA